MKKILVIGLISGFFSAGAFAAACTSTAAAAGPVLTTAGTADGTTKPTPGETCVCDGATATKVKVNGGSGTVMNIPQFVKNGFDVQCSNNTVVSYDEVSATAFAVSSGSRKGNQSFIGSSNGGSVTTYQKCTDINDSCSGANVSTAHDAAAAAAVSS